MALRKVDIVGWESDVARQYRIRSIPALWLYKGTKQVETDSRRVMRYLEES